jgi:hypothetical protein
MLAVLRLPRLRLQSPDCSPALLPAMRYGISPHDLFKQEVRRLLERCTTSKNKAGRVFNPSGLNSEVLAGVHFPVLRRKFKI